MRDRLKSLDDLASREETSAKESKLAALKIDLAQKSNKVSKLESQLDKVPSSYELNQYQVLSVLYSSNFKTCVFCLEGCLFQSLCLFN